MAKRCDSCKTAPSDAFCRADSAFLCLSYDSQIHAATNLTPPHARVLVCEQAPASVTCKADAAVLCAACDRDIHSANPLARRHDRLPVVPFYDAAARPSPSEEFSEKEAEAASWLLLPNPNDHADEDLISGQQNPSHVAAMPRYSADGVVPVQDMIGSGSDRYSGPAVDGFPTYEMECPGSKPFMYNFTSSSQDAGVVPDHTATADSFGKSQVVAIPVLGPDREARVLRYREKRKNRKFEKTIRYASRKAYAETRPRIKGRFVKRSELREVESLIGDDASYGLVRTF